MMGAEAEIVARAEAVSREVLARFAPRVDAENRFPRESIAALHDAGLVGLMVPRELGGLGGGHGALARVAAALGEGCLSSALIWAMHSQMVVTLADHRGPAHEAALEAVARQGALVASVATEASPVPDHLCAASPLRVEDGRLRLRRAAPIVSYGEHAGFYLVMMLAAEGRPAEDVRLVLVRRDDGDIRAEGGWDAMGMRGTRSVPMRFDVLVDPDRVVGASFREVAFRTLIPSGELALSAAWYGAARGAVRRFVRKLRGDASRGGRRLDSDLLLSRLAGLRLALDLVAGLLDKVSLRLERYRAEGAPLARYVEEGHVIELNSLKIAASELSVGVADQLVELAGLREGYLQGGELGLERTFRDLRSASLMIGNERLRQANGRLMLLEGTPVRSALAGQVG
jgi:acyl-CoA dehydrogenase